MDQVTSGLGLVVCIVNHTLARCTSAVSTTLAPKPACWRFLLRRRVCVLLKHGNKLQRESSKKQLGPAFAPTVEFDL